MSITRLAVSNFKSFADINVALGPFNVLLGANASGKSNFVQVFRFLRDSAAYGLDDAVSMQGGADYFANLKLGNSAPVSLKVTEDMVDKLPARGNSELQFYERTYSLSLKLQRRAPVHQVLAEELNLRFKIVESVKEVGVAESTTELGEGTFTLWKEKGRLRHQLRLPAGYELEERFPFFSAEVWEYPGDLLILRHPFLRLGPFEPEFASAAIFDFDPKLPKRAVPLTGRAELDEDGSNLAVVLRAITSDRDKRRQFLNAMGDLLPFVSNLRFEAVADKSLLFLLEERFRAGQYLPASLLSDGTISIAALIAALYFESRPFKVIEEPERNLHPMLIGKIIDMMHEASVHGQLLITTNNSEVVKHAPLASLILIQRTAEGLSVASRPSESSQVIAFLKNDIGVDDLFIRDLLAV